ncbi:Carbamoyl-phosphate synth [Mycena sanguinolenta]|uniref:Carbamoyl-phosphate synth n=1 Tax=Mycena sanguinolenta TaxID=230812 RepID=A0A8H7D4N7_9AGAR|nr:Carbamoyl-phosphate synth [Mycena sanguinolenta]
MEETQPSMTASASHSLRDHPDFEPILPAAVPEPHFPRTETPRQESGSDNTEARQTRGVSFQTPKLPEDERTAGPGQRDASAPQRRPSGLDWIIPVEPKREHREKTFQERIAPSLKHARLEREKCELKARMTGYALNVAIGLQVLFGALTTGIAAATTGRQASIATAILGGFATIVASYLARARGSNEPELSTARVKDLDQYIRECEIFILDYGHFTGHDHDAKLTALRDRYEELLGNANGERRLASV